MSTRRDRRSRLGLASLLFLSALGAGCAGAGTKREPPLPFHVAVIPIPTEQAGASATEKQPEDAKPSSSKDDSKEFHLALDSARASQAVTKALEDDGFARATLLRYPAGISPAEFEAKPAAERDAHWVREAKLVGADLVLECDLRYSPSLKSGSNEKFWLNLPLFLLGGPACYFVDDVSYKGEARLDFLDRADGNVGLFAASILVPAGFLSHEGAGAEEKIADAVAQELAKGLDRAVRDDAREIVVADRLTAFHLDPKYSVEMRGRAVHFSGEAVIRRGEQERMDSFTVTVGAKKTSGEFGPGTPDRMNSTRHTQYVRFPFEADVPLEKGADRIVIELTSAGANPGTRTFTIPLNAAKAGGDEGVRASVAAKP